MVVRLDVAVVRVLFFVIVTKMWFTRLEIEWYQHKERRRKYEN
jgi:hypothetical protein